MSTQTLEREDTATAAPPATAAVAVPTAGALAVAPGQTMWTPEQRAVLLSTGISEDVSNAELAAFLHECQRTGLDPFTRQIYLIGRFDKSEGRKIYRSQTGIDGYRLIAHRAAERTGNPLSYEDTLWCGPDGMWRDVWLEERPPAAAKVVIHRGTARFSAVATLAEYNANSRMWRAMPANMVAKCAEALCLRKAFPQDLSGIYTAEEMAQADYGRAEQSQERRAVRQHRPDPARTDEWTVADAEQEPVDAEVVAEPEQPRPRPRTGPDRPATEPQQRKIHAQLRTCGIPEAERHETVSTIIDRPVTSMSDLTMAEAKRAIDLLEWACQGLEQSHARLTGWVADRRAGATARADDLCQEYLAATAAADSPAGAREVVERAARDQERGRLSAEHGGAIGRAYLARLEQLGVSPEQAAGADRVDEAEVLADAAVIAGRS